MKTSPDETQIVRWLDGEMDAAESAAFEKEVAAHPERRAEMESMKKLGATLRASVPASREVPHADFFNSQIQVRIAQEEMDAERSRPRSKAGVFSWLRIPMFATAAALIAIAGLLWMQRGSGSGSVILSSYVPNPGVQARTFHDDEANATVIILDGLAEYPADKSIAGHRVHHSETDTAVATTTLFSEDGGVLLVLAKDARNQPRVLSHSPRG